MRRRQFLAAPVALAASTRLQEEEEPQALEGDGRTVTSGDAVEPKCEWSS